MKILWVVNIVIPDAAEHINQEKIVFGGWITEMIRELSSLPRIEIAVAMRTQLKNVQKKEKENTTYYFLPVNASNKFDVYKKDVDFVLDDFKPDILHAEGSEMAYTLTFLKNWKGKNVVSMQGILNGYEPYEYGSLNLDDFFLSFNLKKILFAAALLVNKRFIFKKRILKEKEIISKAKNILGRTSWDKAHSSAINNEAPYFHCSRLLRKSFYDKNWDIDSCEEYSLFIGNSASPRKGAHFVLEAVALLKKDFPNIKLYIAGNTPQPSSWKDWKKKIGYPNHFLRLIKKLKLEDNIVFLGILSENEMAEKLSQMNVYLMASVIENSPNTLGEAMMMGVPCIASYNGGVPDMAIDNVEALLYRDNDPIMLAHKIKLVFNNRDLALSLSSNGQKKARITHNRANNIQLLVDAYETIMK